MTNPFVRSHDWGDDREVSEYLKELAGDVSKDRFDRLQDLANGMISMSDRQLLMYLVKEMSKEAHQQRAVAIVIASLLKRIEHLEKRVAEE